MSHTFEASWDFLKAMKPHRQKVLPSGSDKEMRLQQWANRHPDTKAQDPEARTAFRDQLMRNAISDPMAHGLSFVGGEPIPFEEEERQTTLGEFSKMVNTRSSGGKREPASFRRRMRNPQTTAGAPAQTPQTKEPQGQFLQQQANRADRGLASDMEKLKQTDPEAYSKLMVEQRYAPDERLDQTRLLDFVGKMNVYKADPYEDAKYDMYRNQNPSYLHHPENPFDRPLPARPDDPPCPQCEGTGKNYKTFHHGGPPDCSHCDGTGKIRRTMGDIYREKNPDKYPQPSPPNPLREQQENPYGMPPMERQDRNYPPNQPHTPFKGPPAKPYTDPDAPYGQKNYPPQRRPYDDGRPNPVEQKMMNCIKCGRRFGLDPNNPSQKYRMLCPECDYESGMPNPYGGPGQPPLSPQPMAPPNDMPQYPGAMY